MNDHDRFRPSRLIRDLRERAGLTQAELAIRVGTTQSVISRLESDGYDGHSMSMLTRIGEALGRRLEVVELGPDASLVSEGRVQYGASDAARESAEGLTATQVDRLAGHLADRFRSAGVSREEIDEVIRTVQAQHRADQIERLRGIVEVGSGDVLADVRRARRQRGTNTVAGT